MICDRCNIERLITDFLKNHKFCYKCVYQEKIIKSKEKRTKKGFLCRCCGIEFFIDKTSKKRQRSVFCSQECALKGHKEQTNNYWTRKIKTDGFGAYGRKENKKWKINQK